MLVIGMILAVAMPLHDVATNSIATRIAACDPTVSLCRFVNYPGCFNSSLSILSKPKLNDKFWLKDVDFSCVSPWNSGGGRVRAGTAISKRHVIFASHFPLAKGCRILFVGQDGEVCPCYIDAVKEVGLKSDMSIGLLNAELTPNIHPAKLLPVGFEKHLGDMRGLPVVTFNQFEKAFLTEVSVVPTNALRSCMMCSRRPKNSDWERFRENIVSGDSGDPAFILIGNEPILIYCLTGGGAGAGLPIHRFRNEVQATMDALCPGYALEEFDFAHAYLSVMKRCGDLN